MLLYHLRHAIRLLARERGFTTAAVLTLALGIGANAAVFAVIEAVLLRPLPYPDDDRLLIVQHRDSRTGITKPFIAMGDFVDLADRQTVFESIDAYGGGPTTVTGLGDPVPVSALSASPSLFDTLRVKPALGRALTRDDGRPGAPAVVLLGYNLWETHFGSDPRVIGRSIRVGTASRQVVGIAPAGFRFPPHAPADIIVPATIAPAAPAPRKSGWVFAVGRLRPGVDPEDATAQLSLLSALMEREHPSENKGSEYYALTLRDALVGDTKSPLLLMGAAVVLVLLIACTNVANLLLVRSLGRRREMAVRVALGAGRGRLAAQLIAESLVLSGIGGLAGVALAFWGVPALVAIVPRVADVPGLQTASVDWLVLAFAFIVSVVTAVCFGLAAAGATRKDAARGAALTSSTRAGVGLAARRATSALVVLEIAIAGVLLVAAGLVIRSFAALLAVDPGFSTASVLTIDIQLPADRYSAVPAREAFYTRAFERLAQTPGLSRAGAAVVTPLTGNNWTVPFERSDRPVPAGERPPDVGWQLASGGYFRTLEIPLLSGRFFDGRDGPAGGVAVIVSESIERRFFPGEKAVGHRVRLGQEEAEIVGVVGDIRRAGLTDAPRADMYFPFEHSPAPAITLFMKTDGDPLAALPAVRTALRELEPSMVVTAQAALADIAAESIAVTRLALWLLGLFAVLALALAGVGVYGVMSYAVRQRTHEIGTRLALGATHSRIAWMVLRDAAAIAAIGLPLGLGGGLTAARSLGSLLYGVPPTDPATLAGVGAVLAVTMAVACLVPARRATQIHPRAVLDR